MSYTFPMEHQTESDWCWNAVAVSIVHYFNPHSTMTQEKCAELVLGESLPASNRPFSLSAALHTLEELHENRQGALRFEEIRKQLDANLPVCAHIAWNEEGQSHFVVITGYAMSPDGRALVYVSDPILRDGNVVLWDYEVFALVYSPRYTNAEGTWVETCVVTSASRGK